MYYSPPYKKEFTKSENNFFIKKINDFKPDILFVGMTAPKQEKWVYNNYKKIDCKIFSTIGAVFDFYAGRIKRAPQIFILLGLEWFYRFLQEPKRLFQRNFISAPKFLFYLFIEKIKNIFKSIFKPF